ncbi:MAG: alanine racemase [Clostridia bacterium]|nr:alanine racemase [Clostridia bacterium]
MEVTSALRLEINLDTLRNNLAALKKLTPARVCAVVKADAYGHGTGALAALTEADEFAVSSVGEALEISEITDKPINVLSSPDKTVSAEYRANVFPSVSDIADLEFTAARGAKAVNIKADTGMSRYGSPLERLGDLLKAADKLGVKIKSAFSHVYHISEAERQFERFMTGIQPLKDYIPQKHILASNFAVLPEYMHLDMVRPGIALYGYGHESVKPIAKALCGVTLVRKVSESDNIGYGVFKSGRVRKIAVLGAGYADGVRRVIGKSPRYVSINGNMCPLIGQVCMDAAMADVSGLDVKAGDTAYVLCAEYNADSIATACGTISYEVLTGFGKRVKRYYVRD